MEPSTPILSLLRTDGAVRAQDKITRKQENNAIVNNAVNKILLTQKLSATNHEALEFLDSDYDANDLFEVDKMSLEDTKEKLN